MTVPYSSPALNELTDGYWVIETVNWLGRVAFLHDPDLKTVSDFDGAYRYSVTDDAGTFKRHLRTFKKRHGDFVNDRGPFMFIKPRYVSAEYAARVRREN